MMPSILPPRVLSRSFGGTTAGRLTQRFLFWQHAMRFRIEFMCLIPYEFHLAETRLFDRRNYSQL